MAQTTIQGSFLGDGTVTGAKVAADFISAQTALASGLATTDEIIVSDAGVIKRMDISVLEIAASQITASGTLPALNGAALTALNGTQVTTGTVADARIAATISRITGTETLSSKSIDLGTNTLTGSVAEFNTALQSESFATLGGTETLVAKTLTSPVLNTGVSGSAVLDEDNLATNSATQLATQQSIKAYADTKAPIAGATFTGTTQFATLSDGTIAVTAWVDEDNMSSNSATLIPTQQSVKAYVDTTATIADDSIVEAKLDVSNGPTDGFYLQAQSGEGGGLTWAAVDAGGVVSGGTNNAVLRADGTGGSTSQGSGVILTDANNINAGNGTACLPTFSFSATPESGVFRPTGCSIGFSVTTVERFRICGWELQVGEGAPGNNHGNISSGVHISQSTSDDLIFALKSSDVGGIANSALTNKEADDYFIIQKVSAATGGAQLGSYKEDGGGAEPNMRLDVQGGNPTTAHTTGGAAGLVSMYIYEHDGSSTAVCATAEANLFTIITKKDGVGFVAVFNVDEDGDAWADNGHQTMDEYCDAQLARSLTLASKDSGNLTGYIANKWDEFVTYNEDDLVKANILGAPVACGGMLSITGLQRLHNGAIWQLHSRLQDQAEELIALRGQVLALTEGK